MVKCKGKKPVKMAFGGMLSSMGGMLGGRRPTPMRKPAMSMPMGGGVATGTPVAPTVNPMLSSAQSMLGSSPMAGMLMAKTRMGMMARGGKVGGRAERDGDSESNDKVPALLSPGEIVVPRSKAKSAKAAKSFVGKIIDGVKRKRGK